MVLVLAALNPWFWGLPPLLVLAGAAMTVSNTAANSLLQATAEPGLLGQTVSLYMLAMRGGSRWERCSPAPRSACSACSTPS